MQTHRCLQTKMKKPVDNLYWLYNSILSISAVSGLVVTHG
ncbi:hypothetical protein JCM19233_3128 [Vibrio astriarenae]|nr:hypothetical protein JCM19233_3128 [Vibrio sp. C7]